MSDERGGEFDQGYARRVRGCGWVAFCGLLWRRRRLSRVPSSDRWVLMARASGGVKLRTDDGGWKVKR